jgi:hypothetical protein
MNLAVHKDSMSLCLEGIFVDTITKIGVPLLRDDKREGDDAQNLCCSLREWLHLSLVVLPSEAFVEDAVNDQSHQTSLVGPRGRVHKGQSGIATFSDPEERYVTGETRLDAFWHAMLGGLILHPDGSRPLRRCCRSDYTLLNAILNTETLTNSPGLNLSLQQWLMTQTFFMTKQGYMGTAPGTIERGDQVWILFGSNVPFVLRDITVQNRAGKCRISEHLSEEQDFLKIGDCYVDGIMKGEMVQDSRNRSRIINLF